jgi:hypothetical protein
VRANRNLARDIRACQGSRRRSAEPLAGRAAAEPAGHGQAVRPLPPQGEPLTESTGSSGPRMASRGFLGRGAWATSPFPGLGVPTCPGCCWIAAFNGQAFVAFRRFRASGGCSSGTSIPSASRSARPFRDAEVSVVDPCLMVDRRYPRTGKPPRSTDQPRKWYGRDWRGDPGRAAAEAGRGAAEAGRSHAHRRLDGQPAGRAGAAMAELTCSALPGHVCHSPQTPYV